jgi:hypothetical protein
MIRNSKLINMVMYGEDGQFANYVAVESDGKAFFWHL